MGIFSTLKALLFAKQNYKSIIQSIAISYYCIRETNFGKRLTNDQLLFATAIGSFLPYLDTTNIQLSDLEHAVTSGQIGVVSLGGYFKRYQSPTDFITGKNVGENAELVGLAMNLVALLSAEGGKADYRSIVDSIAADESTFKSVVNQTIQQGSLCKLYNQYSVYMNQLVSNDSAQDAILAYSSNK